MSLYSIIDDLRRENQTPAASKTLDLVVSELGATNDNLRLALERLGDRTVPTGGKPLLEELETRARAEGVYDLDTPQPRSQPAPEEPLDESQIGIGVLLGGSALLTVALAALAVGLAVRAIVTGG